MSDESVDLLLARGFGLLEDQDFEGAAGVGEQLLAMRHSSAFEILALAHAGFGDTERAVGILEDGTKNAPKMWVLWQLLGNNRSEPGRYIHTDKDHCWHMDTLARLCAADEALLLTTPRRVIQPGDTASEEEGVAWWTELTEQGGEGMVVKPLHFIAKGKKGLVQPALKCRGREYLRIIYGPEYTADENLDRLRSRALATKRSLALREFALGIEGLERFVRQEPLRRVHECVFGVLALESEPVDPRL